MNREQAQRLVEAELGNMMNDYASEDCIILEDKTIEKTWGWVFFYQNRKFIETGDFREMLGGNSPIIVNRNSGKLFVTGTACDVDRYIREYEATL